MSYFSYRMVAMRVAIMEAILKDIRRIIIHHDSQVVVNFINIRCVVPKESINLVDDVKYLLAYFSDSSLEYCSRFINKDADALTKKTHM